MTTNGIDWDAIGTEEYWEAARIERKAREQAEYEARMARMAARPVGTPATPPTLRTWSYHTHTHDWAGADGTVEATTSDEAHRKVAAWVERQGILGVDDEMGPYVKITGPVEA